MAPKEFFPCTLRQLLAKIDPWHKNRVVYVYTKIIRSVVKSIVLLELKGIKTGSLSVDDIQIDENYEAILPATDSSYVGKSYKQEFVYLMEAILGKDKNRTLELSHFFNMIDCEREWYRFEQLIYHPLLQSPTERFRYYNDGLLYLQHVEGAENKNVRELFTMRWDEKVDIKGAVGELKGFHSVLSKKEYKDNVLGALEYSSDVCLVVNDHLIHEEHQAPDQVEEKLNSFFPKLLLQLYTFLIEMYTHMDLREQIKEEEGMSQIRKED